jgi:hypothetical protein
MGEGLAVKVSVLSEGKITQSENDCGAKDQEDK